MDELPLWGTLEEHQQLYYDPITNFQLCDPPGPKTFESLMYLFVLVNEKAEGQMALSE